MDKTIVHISSDLEPLIPRYVDNRLRDITTLREAFQRGDYEQIGSIAHTLKGSGASYGLPVISAIGSALEASAKSSQTAQIDASINQLAHFMETLEIIFVDDMS